ncbi:copper resistance protein CopC [Xanthobacter autotrophicus]|uniref:copper resistance CopC family protein n=1 Tax=Xanthobacter autotrophicus TaxID=280 RepID=UPI0024AB331B|nr:copper resistance protein CopC [Xanthobacter autotrophicus]MDI4665580.1 copper resistance protein CopC [Xanthobacter autotrophicus]
MHPASAIAALVAGLVVGTAAPALAQCAFDQSVPNANDVLGDAEPAVTIDFTDEFELHEVRVVGSDNAEWPTDWTRPAGQVRQTAFRVTRPLPPGKYMVIWNGYLRRHYHADGGSIPFTVAAAGEAPTPHPAAAPQEGGVHRVGPGSPYRVLLGGGAPQPAR